MCKSVKTRDVHLPWPQHGFFISGHFSSIQYSSCQVMIRTSHVNNRNQVCEPMRTSTGNCLPIMGDHHRPLTPITSSLRCCSGKATEASRKLPRTGVGLPMGQWSEATQKNALTTDTKIESACGIWGFEFWTYCVRLFVVLAFYLYTVMEVCIRVIRTFTACKFKKSDT